jgi:hypothetical protein
MKTKNRRGRKATGPTKDRVTLTIDKKLLPLAKKLASVEGGLSALVEDLLAFRIAEHQSKKDRLSSPCETT